MLSATALLSSVSVSKHYVIRAAVILAGLALTQSLICFLYLILQIMANGTNGTLGVEVELWDALMPVIFLMLSSIIFLLENFICERLLPALDFDVFRFGTAIIILFINKV